MRTAALLALASVLLAGCTNEGSAETEPSRQVVEKFFDALESGQTGSIAALLTDDSALDSAVLQEDFYADVVAAPSDATIGAAVETEPGLVYVSVDYSIAGEERSIKVAVEQSGETARIASWLDDTLSIAPLRSPGAFEVNGSLAVGELEESQTFVALPGVYEFVYVDPAGLGTVDPDGKPTTSFEVEFPIEAPQLTSVVPPGVEALGSGISAEPILLAEVDDEVESQLADVIAECSASGLVGDSCPTDLVSRVSSQGEVDVSTIVWKRDETQPPSTSADWDLVAGYSIAYRLESGSASTADATYSGIVTATIPGTPVLEITR